MNATTSIAPPAAPAFDPSSFDHAAFHGFRPEPGATRHEGWSAERQRQFLEALSEGLTVKQACEVVGLSKQSAYALRTSARGASFALGWDAAVLVSRNALADELMDRAFRGTRETLDDGSRVITRHRYDNRLALAMLNRLDRMADAAKAPAAAAAARLVAADFTQYLDLVGRDAGPARAGMFLGARVEAADEDELAPIRSLARADKWLRTRTDLADPVDTRDLDPAERGGWTGEQWARAEAAGLVRLAPPPEKVESSQASQPAGPSGGAAAAAADPLDDLNIWFDEAYEAWHTSFPPPEGFDGAEYGDYGDQDYWRDLTPAETALVDTLDARAFERQRIGDAAARDAWIARLAAAAAAVADAAEEAPADAAAAVPLLTAAPPGTA